MGSPVFCIDISNLPPEICSRLSRTTSAMRRPVYNSAITKARARVRFSSTLRPQPCESRSQAASSLAISASVKGSVCPPGESGRSSKLDQFLLIQPRFSAQLKKERRHTVLPRTVFALFQLIEARNWVSVLRNVGELSEGSG